MIIAKFKKNLAEMVADKLALGNHDVKTNISVDPNTEKDFYEQNLNLAQQYQESIKKLQNTFNDATTIKYAVDIKISNTYTDESQLSFQKLKEISKIFGTEDILIRGDTHYYDCEDPSLSETNTIITVCNINQEKMLNNIDNFLKNKTVKKIKP